MKEEFFIVDKMRSTSTGKYCKRKFAVRMQSPCRCRWGAPAQSASPATPCAHPDTFHISPSMWRLGHSLQGPSRSWKNCSPDTSAPAALAAPCSTCQTARCCLPAMFGLFHFPPCRFLKWPRSIRSGCASKRRSPSTDVIRSGCASNVVPQAQTSPPVQLLQCSCDAVACWHVSSVFPQLRLCGCDAAACPHMCTCFTGAFCDDDMVFSRPQMLETARSAFEASGQCVSLTNLSGRRDMSLLLALSACQVSGRIACCGPGSEHATPPRQPVAHCTQSHLLVAGGRILSPIPNLPRSSPSVAAGRGGRCTARSCSRRGRAASSTSSTSRSSRAAPTATPAAAFPTSSSTGSDSLLPRP